MRIDSSRQAFPSDTVVNRGMTLRDWFASQALSVQSVTSELTSTELTTLFGKEQASVTDADVVAARAYLIADAMLARRSK